MTEIGCEFSRLNEKHVEDTYDTLFKRIITERTTSTQKLTFLWAAIERQSRRLSSIVCPARWCHCRPHWPIAVVVMAMAPVKSNCCSANPNESIRSIGGSIWRDFDATHCCCLYYLQIDYGDARAYRCRSHHCSLHVRLVYAISSHLECSLCSTRNCCALDFEMSLMRVTEENRFENEIYWKN